MQYEYKKVYLIWTAKLKINVISESELNELGQARWRLVTSMRDGSGDCIGVFIREVHAGG